MCVFYGRVVSRKELVENRESCQLQKCSESGVLGERHVSASPGTMMRTNGRGVGFWKSSGGGSRPLTESSKLQIRFPPVQSVEPEPQGRTLVHRLPLDPNPCFPIMKSCHVVSAD